MLRDVTRRRSGAGNVPLPRIFAPQLATLVDTAPEGDEWLHELKFDGYRIGCRIDGRTVSLISRNGKDWTDHFPEVATAARELAVRRAFLDGEVAMLLSDGRTSFQALQNASATGAPFSAARRFRMSRWICAWPRYVTGPVHTVSFGCRPTALSIVCSGW